MCLQSDGGSCPQSVGRSAKVCLLDAIKPISLLLGQYRCWIAENIIATVTDSSQLKKNNELMKYIKNSDWRTAPGPTTTRALSTAPPKGGAVDNHELCWVELLNLEPVQRHRLTILWIWSDEARHTMISLGRWLESLAFENLKSWRILEVSPTIY